MERQTNRRRPGLTTLVFLSVAVGLACGLFFGEACGWLKWIGDGFVGLLQMAVLPYVTFSLMANIGRLSWDQERRLLATGAAVLAFLWAIGLAAMLLMSLAFPSWQTGSFFSTSFVEAPPHHNWVEYFIPSNPFWSLTNNLVPAVVLFSIGLGLALMGIPNKARLLEQLDIAVEALSRLNRMVINLAPIGIFAIVASASGTLDLEQFELLQGYLLTYMAAAILLSCWVLPALIASCTPFSYRDVMDATRNVMVTAFVIGNSFVVLPLMIEATRELLAKYGLDDTESGATPASLIPMAYPFPDIGRILGLVFIPFAAWFYGTSIDQSEYPSLIGVGLLGSFAKPVVTIPILLEIAHIPSDIFNLYLSMGVIAARFGDLIKTMHLVTFATLTSCVMSGTLQIKWKRLAVQIVTTAVFLGLIVVSIHGYLDTSFKTHYSKDKLITGRKLLHDVQSIDAQVVREVAEAVPNPDPLLPDESRVERIRRRGIVRVGYDPDELPFSYFNANDELVGFDVEMAYRLARNMRANIEFVPFRTSTLIEQLEADHFDVAMAGLQGTLHRAAQLGLGDSYLDVTLAVVVLDFRKSELNSLDKILAAENLKLAVIRNSFFAERIADAVPNAEIVEVDSERDFFTGAYQDVDALVTSAETGSAWTLRRPQFSVVNPLAQSVHVPLYYMALPDSEWREFLDKWLELVTKTGFNRELYDYWILGIDHKTTAPRWCIMRDVLHWVD